MRIVAILQQQEQSGPIAFALKTMTATCCAYKADGVISVPSEPLNVQLQTVSQDALQVAWDPPARDGGAAVSAYLVEWDPEPGVREAQVVQTRSNTGANEVQTVRTFAADVDEVQQVSTMATLFQEVQSITTRAAPGEVLGGVFTIELDTTVSGGSKQISGVIGYNAPASGDRSSVLEILNAMSNIGSGGVQSVSRSTADPQGGYTWLLLTGSGANVVLNTPVNGNVIAPGSTFTLGFRGAQTAEIAYDASDVAMQQTLEALSTIESVNVVRIGPDYQHGYKWKITFTSNSPLNTGDVPMLTVGANSKLTGAGAVATVQQLVAGNQLAGSFQLKYTNNAGTTATTGDLEWNCDAATMKSELEKINTGTLDVSRTQLPDPQGGFTWTISFLMLKGSFAPLTSVLTRLTESRTDSVVSKGLVVTRTRPGTVQEIQNIKVTTTAAAVSTTTYFSLKVSFASQTTTTGPIPANAMADGTCMSSKPEIQQIKVTTVDTTAAGGDNLVSSKTAFQLIYTSNTEAGTIEETNTIIANPALGDCSIAAAAIKKELEALDGTVGTITVSSSATVATQMCTWAVTFSNQPGNLVQLQVVTPNNGAGPAGSITIGDDTISISTLTDGSIDIIKTELEKLANVAQVTVSASPAATPNTAQACTWSVTFDGNAGDLPLMQVSVDNDATFGASKTTASGDTVAIVANRDGTSQVLGGVFSLEFDGQRTGYMPFDVSAVAMKNQLEALSTIGDVAITRSNADPNNGYAWTISFLNNLGDLTALQPDMLALTGTAPQIQVQKRVKGILPRFNSKDPVNEIPSAPTNVSLASVDGTSIAVRLNAPLSDGGSPLDAYRVEYGLNPIRDEVQEVQLRVPVVNEIQTITTSTNTVGEVQLVHLTSTYSGTVANEVQRVSCDALSAGTGSFTLSFLGETTAPIYATETSTTVIQTILQELASITSVSVSFYGSRTTACASCSTVTATGCTSGLEITFLSIVGRQGAMPYLTANTYNLEGNRRVDIARQTVGQAPVSGTFRLTYLRGRDTDTAPLLFSASAATVQAAIAALDASVTVVVTDGTSALPAADIAAGARLWRVTFQNSGYIPDMLVRPANNLLMGNGANIKIYTKEATYGAVPASVTGNRVTGKFRLALGGHVTDLIDHDASDTTMKRNLEALPNIGTVTVTRTGPSLKNEYVWTVTFIANPGSFPIGAGNIDPLTTDSTALLGTNSQITIATLLQGSSPVDGTFQLKFTDGVAPVQNTIDLSPHETADGIQRALRGISSIGDVSVSRSTVTNGYTWQVTFNNCRASVCNIGDVNMMTSDTTKLTGGAGTSIPTVTVVEVVKGVGPLQTMLITDLSGGEPYEALVSGLLYGTKYYARVSFHNAVSFGHRALSVPEFVMTKNLAPGAPRPVLLVSSSATTITLAWTSPTVNGGATVSGYELWLSEWGDVYRKVYDRPNDALTLTTTLKTTADNAIESGKKYWFKVRAINFCTSSDPSASCYGEFSAPVEYTVRSPVMPEPPASLTRDSTTTINTAAANDGIAVVNWAPPIDNGGSSITGYELYMDDGSGWVKQTMQGVFPYGYSQSIPNLKEGNVYRFYMRAINAIGPSAKTPVLSIVLANVPSAPSAPTLVDVTATSIRVSWLPPSSCTSTLTGCNGSPLLGYKLWEFPGVTSGYTVSGSPVNNEIQRIQTTVATPVPETQSITIVDASGQFALYVNGKMTALLAAGTSAAGAATTAQVKAAVEMCGVGTVAVTSTALATGMTWTVTFSTWQGPLTAIVIVPDKLTNTVLATVYSTQVTRVQAGTSALGGDFTVSFRGFETTNLAVSTTAAEMKRQLENLPSIGVIAVSTTAGTNNAMAWDITFLTELGDVPLMKVTSGRLTGGASKILVSTMQVGTPGRIVYDGTMAPNVLAFSSMNLVPDTLYAYVVVAINAAGDGIGGVSTPAIAASSGAFSFQTVAHGAALVQGMAGIVYEVQSVATSNLAAGTFKLRWSATGPWIGPISTAMTAAQLETLLPSTDPSLGEVHVSRQDLNGADCVWYITFADQVGDLPLLVADDVVHVLIQEFVKGEANQFAIAPRKASGDVVTYATMPPGFQGQDLFWTELWSSPPSVVDGTHSFVSDGGLAVYNPVVYEIQTITFNGVAGTFTFKLDTSTTRLGGVIATSTIAVNAATLATATTSDATASQLVKTSLETLSNLQTVRVSRVKNTGGSVVSWTYAVTFISNLCDLPSLQLVGDTAFMASSTLLTMTPVMFTEIQKGVCDVQTVTTSASVESSAEIQSIRTWLDDSGTLKALGGTFTLAVGGTETITVPVTADAATMKTLLESVSTIDDVTVTVTNSNYNTATGLQTWLVTFNEILGSVPDITVASTASLTGYKAQVIVKEVRRMGLSLGGTFVLNFMGDTTFNLPFDIEPLQIKTELENLQVVREVDVKKEELFNGNRWTISFTKNLGDLPKLEALPYAYEIQEIETLEGSPTPLEGSFTLSFIGETTSAIPFDASRAVMKAALEALPSVGLVDVTRTDKLDAGNRFKWQVTFRSKLGNIGNLVPDASRLTGSFPDVVVTELQPGSTQSLTGNYPKLSVFKKQSGFPRYTARYIPMQARSNYSVAVRQLQSGGLAALYYDNYWFQDEPVIMRVDPQLQFDWGHGAITNYGRDYISIRWFGKLAAPYTDSYVIYVKSSEGVRVWLNHTLYVDTWEQDAGSGGMRGTNENFHVNLVKGTFYDIKIEYHEDTGDALLFVAWSSSYLPLQPIPKSALYHGDHILGSPFAITVTPGATDFPHTTAFGQGLKTATAGIMAQLTIQAKDQHGNNKTTDGDSFDISIAGNVLLAPFEEPLYIGDGQYRVQYLPAVSGTYQLSIKTVDGIDIYCGLGKVNKCSPFRVTISPGATTSHTSQALGNVVTSYGVIDGLVEAVAGQVSNFTIQARDTYGNAKWLAAVGSDRFETKMVLVADRNLQYRSSVLSVTPASSPLGIYQMQYSIPRAGIYELQTYLNGSPILMCPAQLCQVLGTPASLKVVHSELHGPMSTVDDATTNALSTATSGHATSFNVYARDTFGNLRIGDRTTNSKSTGDGRSDVFLVVLRGNDEEVRTSSTVQILQSTAGSSGYFKLTYGSFRFQLCANCVTALTSGTSLSANVNLVGLLLPNTKFAVQECIFTAVSVTAATISVASNHGCAAFTSKQWPLQVASTTSGKLTPLIPYNVNAAALKYILEDLHYPNAATVKVDRVNVVGGGYKWLITFISHLKAWSEAHLAVEYPNGFASSMYANPLTVSYAAAGGVYPVHYNPYYAGNYTMSITTWDEQVHVSGSPFTVRVAGDATDGASCLAAHGNWLVENFSEPLIELNAGEELRFQVQLKDTRRLEQQVIRLRAVALPPVATVQRVFVQSASFQLSFRNSPTISLADQDAYATVKTKLESLYTITDGGIQVSTASDFASDTKVTLNHAFLVTFTMDSGTLPTMDAVGAQVSTLTQGVTSYRKEIQTLTCTSSATPAADGNFIAMFGGQTATIAANAALTGPAGGTSFSALLTTLLGGSAVIVYAEGTQTTVCAGPSPKRIFIQFDQLVGDIAALAYSTPVGSTLVITSENDSGGGVKGVYPAWGTFRLFAGGSDNANDVTASIPFDASALAVDAAIESLLTVDTVSVTRDWFDITTETLAATTVTLVQWTVTFTSHAGNFRELVPDSMNLQMNDDGQFKPFVEVRELARGTLGNNRSLAMTSDIDVTLTTVLEDPGVQEKQTLLCRGTETFTLTYAGNSVVIAPYLSLSELQIKLNTIISTGVRVHSKDTALESTYFPVCSVASAKAIEIVFEVPQDVPLIQWSTTSNDIYLTESVKGQARKDTPIAIANKEIHQLTCSVTAASAATASFDVTFGGDTVTIAANTAIAPLQTQLNALASISAAGGVDATSAQSQVCLVDDGITVPAPIRIAFRAIGDPPLLRITNRRDGILQATVVESTKGTRSITYDGSVPGLFNVSIVPEIKGTYDLSVKVLSQPVFFPPNVVVHPTLASGFDTVHTAPAVVVQGIPQRFTIQAIDRFRNKLESSTELGVDGFIPKLVGPRGVSGTAVDDDVYPVTIREAQSNTNGLFHLGFVPQIRGDYTLTLQRRQAGGLTASYFRNVDFTDMIASRQDANIDFRWGEDSPLGDPFPNKYYSVIWAGELRAKATGTHTFTLHADDGVILEVNGITLLDSLTISSPMAVSSSFNSRSSSADTVMKKGTFYTIRVKYRTRDAQSFISLSWNCDATFEAEIVSPQSLFTATALANTPFKIRTYPGALDASQMLNSIDAFMYKNDSSSGYQDQVVTARALETFSFEIEAHDAVRNTKFQDGNSAFEVSLVGVDGWALIGRTNDVITGTPITIDPTILCKACATDLDSTTNILTLNADIARHLIAGTRFRVINANPGTLARKRDCFLTCKATTAFVAGAVTLEVEPKHGCEAFTSQSFAVSGVFPKHWWYLGTCAVLRGDMALTSCSNDFTKLLSPVSLERGDLIVVGSESHRVHTTDGAIGATKVPLTRAYLGESNAFVPVYKAGDVTGRHVVSFVPYVKGKYQLSVKVPHVDAVYAVTTTAASSLGGTFQLYFGKTARTSQIAFNADAATMKTVLESVNGIPAGGVTTASSCVNNDATQGCRWLITFAFDTAGKMELKPVYEGVLTGNNAKVTAQVLTEPRSAQLIRGFPKTIEVRPGPTNPSVSTAYGRGLYTSVAGENATFYIQMKDTHGNNKDDRDTPDALRMHVFPNAAPFTDTQVATIGPIRYMSEGLYNVTYSPIKSGVHTVTVTTQTKPEIQQVSTVFAQITDRGGSFTLRFKGQATDPLAFNANASEVQTALLNLPIFSAEGYRPSNGNATMTQIKVSRSINAVNFGFDYQITFTSVPSYIDMKQLDFVNNLYGANGNPSIVVQVLQRQGNEHIKTTSTLGRTVVNEIQVVRIETTGTTLTGGYFQVAFNGQVTDLLRYDVSASAFQAALETLPSIGIGGVAVTKSTVSLLGSCEWTVTFVGAVAGNAQVEYWSSTRYTRDRLVPNSYLVGDLPPLRLVGQTLIGGTNPTVLIFEGGATSTGGVVSVNGRSPFTAIVAHGTIVPEKCTAVDTATPYWPGTTNSIGLGGLHNGKFHSLTNFAIETRDVHSNLLDGTGNGVVGRPVNELQIIETSITGAGIGATLAGTFQLAFGGQKSSALPYNAGIKDVEAALEQLVSIGGTTVDTNDVKTLVVLGTVTATKTSNMLQSGATDFTTVFSVNDWIRVGSLTGPVFTVITITATSITLSSPYFGATNTATSVYKQAAPKTGYTYLVKFDSELGDLPSIVMDPSALSVTGLGTVTTKVTACDTRRTQKLQTTANTQLSGTFYVSYRRDTNRTPMLSWNVDEATLSRALEYLEGLHTVSVSAPVPGLNGGFTWMITLVSTEVDDLDLELLYAEGYMLLGEQARVSVDAVCPSTATSVGEVLSSQSGRLGHSFVATLTGADTISADVTYLSAGKYVATYETPRADSYTLDVQHTKSQGLRGTYFNNRWLYGDSEVVRIDRQVDFTWRDWITPTAKDYVSVRWDGYIKPAFTEDYVISIIANDGARLWVHNQLVFDYFDNEIDESKLPNAVEFRGNTTIRLVKDRLTEILIEYKENAGLALIQLLWESRSQDKAVIAPERLFHRSAPIASSPFAITTYGVKPTAPVNVSLAIAAFDALTVRFYAPLDDGGSNVNGYLVEWWTTGAYGTPEVQMIKLDKANMGGTFTIELDTGFKTGPLAVATVLYSDVEAAIEALDGAGDVTVVMTSAPASTTIDFQVTFNTRTQTVPTMKVNGNNLIGSGLFAKLRLPSHLVPLELVERVDQALIGSGGAASSSMEAGSLDASAFSFREVPGYFLTQHPSSTRYKFTINNLKPGLAYYVNSCSSLRLAWLPSPNVNGAKVTKYLLEWYELPATQLEVQVVKIAGQSTADPVSGTFQVAYNGAMTDDLPIDVDEAEMQQSLEALATLRSVHVERSPASIKGGYEWTITFLAETPAVLGKVLQVASTKMVATAVSVDIGANLDPAHVGAAAKTVAAVQGTSTIMHTGIESYAAIGMYMQVTGNGAEAGIWRVMSVTTNTIKLDQAFRGATGSYTAQIGWTVPGTLPLNYHALEVTNTTTPLSYTISNLPPGVKYYARASPPDVVILEPIISTGSESSSSLQMRFNTTHNHGGAKVTQYKIEWDAMDLEAIEDRAVASATAATALQNEVLFSPFTTQMLLLSADAYDVRGSFRVSFMDVVTSSTLPWDVGADELAAALEQLESVGKVHVRRRSTGNGFAWFKSELIPFDVSATALQQALYKLGGGSQDVKTNVGQVDVFKKAAQAFTGFEYTIVFRSRLGPHQPLIGCDASALKSTSAQAVLRCDTVRTRVGALPALVSDLYGSAIVQEADIVDANGLATFVIQELRPGVQYHVRVSAWNGVGNVFGEPRYSTPAVVPVQSQPDPPRDLSITALSASSVLAAWTPPMNNGGSPIQQYIVLYYAAMVVALLP
uniref:Titin n=1 Tax=Globisporangium ultimum (strain ATCC 200006 / CBS 805.95 / DAOM BR144) TaxID=431595 RepID=K3WF50_GLOUD